MKTTVKNIRTATRIMSGIGTVLHDWEPKGSRNRVWTANQVRGTRAHRLQHWGAKIARGLGSVGFAGLRD